MINRDRSQWALTVVEPCIRSIIDAIIDNLQASIISRITNYSRYFIVARRCHCVIIPDR